VVIKRQTIASYKVMQLFCHVFSKEATWRAKLLGSCVAYYAGLTAEEYATRSKADIAKLFLNRVTKRVKAQLLRIIDGSIWQRLQLTKSAFAKTALDDIFNRLEIIYDDPTQVSHIWREKYDRIYYRHCSLLKMHKLIPSQGDPELFSLLSSKDAAKRSQGASLSHSFFGSAVEIKLAIEQIIQEAALQPEP
jgi:hypothetical protein